jgi:hypothetical protein
MADPHGQKRRGDGRGIQCGRNRSKIKIKKMADQT